MPTHQFLRANRKVYTHRSKISLVVRNDHVMPRSHERLDGLE